MSNVYLPRQVSWTKLEPWPNGTRRIQATVSCHGRKIDYLCLYNINKHYKLYVFIYIYMYTYYQHINGVYSFLCYMLFYMLKFIHLNCLLFVIKYCYGILIKNTMYCTCLSYIIYYILYFIIIIHHIADNFFENYFMYYHLILLFYYILYFLIYMTSINVCIILKKKYIYIYLYIYIYIYLQFWI